MIKYGMWIFFFSIVVTLEHVTQELEQIVIQSPAMKNRKTILQLNLKKKKHNKLQYIFNKHISAK